MELNANVVFSNECKRYGYNYYRGNKTEKGTIGENWFTFGKYWHTFWLQLFADETVLTRIFERSSGHRNVTTFLETYITFVYPNNKTVYQREAVQVDQFGIWS